MKSTYLRQYIAESMHSFNMNFASTMNEAKIKFEVGSKGYLDKTMLQHPAELFKDTYDKLDPLLATKQKFNIVEIFGNDLSFTAWKNYVRQVFGHYPDHLTGRRVDGFSKTDVEHKNMKSARGYIGWLLQLRNGKLRKILPSFEKSDSALGHDDRYPILAFRHDDSIMFGHWVQLHRRIPGCFIACYISTPSSMSTIKLLKDLCQYNNIVFFVTNDIADSLEKLGLLTDGKTSQVKYNGVEVEKKTFATSDVALAAASMALDIINPTWIPA